MGILDSLFGGGTKRRAAELYVKLANRARDPRYYTDLKVADTVDGRYDMIILQVYLCVRALHRLGTADAKAMERALLSAMFSDMDRNLREMGVGDLSVGKKIKVMGDAFHGRALAYDAALEKGEAGRADFEDALLRNVYRSEDGAPVAGLASHFLALDAGWEALDHTRILNGELP